MSRRRVTRFTLGIASLVLAAQARAAYGQTASAFLASGEFKYRRGDLAGAIDDLTQAIDLDPMSERAYTDRGVAREDHGDHDGAIVDFTRAIGLNPANGVNYGLRGSIRQNRGDRAGANADFTQAARDFQAAIDELEGSTGPSDRVRLRLLFEYLSGIYGVGKLDDPAKLESVYLKMIEVEPSNIDAYFDLAKSYSDRGAYDAAEQTIDRGERRSFRTANALSLAAGFYFDRAYHDGALPDGQKRSTIAKGIEAADRALALQPDQYDALMYENLLLRLQATLETVRTKRTELVARANALRDRAAKLRGAAAPRSR